MEVAQIEQSIFNVEINKVQIYKVQASSDNFLWGILPQNFHAFVDVCFGKCSGKQEAHSLLKRPALRFLPEKQWDALVDFCSERPVVLSEHGHCEFAASPQHDVCCIQTMQNIHPHCPHHLLHLATIIGKDEKYKYKPMKAMMKVWLKTK